jgi:ParB-like chromosome segregation protein Spo0J
VPIERDEEGEIIDGFNRAEICEELGIECPANIRKGLTETEKRELALSLNLTRRHLSRGQKQALAIQLRQEGWTQDRIAQVLCMSQATVSSWLVEFISSDKLAHPAQVHGKDGKQYPGRKPRRSSAQRTQVSARTGPEAPTVSTASQAQAPSEPLSRTEGTAPASIPPAEQSPNGDTPPPIQHEDHQMFHGALPENYSHDDVVNPTAPPLVGLVGALHDYLLMYGDLEDLGRTGRSWSPQVRADFLQQSTYIIGQLQAIGQGLEQAVEHDQVAPDAEVAPQDDEHGTGEESTGTITDDTERALVGVEPDVVNEVSRQAIVDTHHKDGPDASHPEAPTGEPDDASDENGAGIPEEGAAAQRLKTLAGYGLSDRAVARRLNEEGLACPRGNGQWDHRKVSRALERMRRGATTVS